MTRFDVRRTQTEGKRLRPPPEAEFVPVTLAAAMTRFDVGRAQRSAPPGVSLCAPTRSARMHTGTHGMAQK